MMLQFGLGGERLAALVTQQRLPTLRLVRVRLAQVLQELGREELVQAERTAPVLRDRPTMLLQVILEVLRLVHALGAHGTHEARLLVVRVRVVVVLPHSLDFHVAHRTRQDHLLLLVEGGGHADVRIGVRRVMLHKLLDGVRQLLAVAYVALPLRTVIVLNVCR